MHRTHPRRALATAALSVLAMVAALAPIGFLAGSAGATAQPAVGYSGNTTAGTIVLKKGDATYERTITNPTSSITATVDDTNGAFSASTTFQPTFTPNQAGPFGLVVYIKAEIIQSAPFTGTIDEAGN